VTSFTFRCGWCQTKDQSAEIVHSHKEIIQDLYRNYHAVYHAVLMCKRCRLYSSLRLRLDQKIPEHLKTHAEENRYQLNISLFSYDGDITEAFDARYAQMPSASSDFNGEVPVTVREAWLDAGDARSPRAKCQSYRTAVEFALRESGLPAKAKQTLGDILKEAQKICALPDALITLCDQVKAFGNWGLHWLETEVTDEDAAAARTITKAILDYLFVLPSEVKKAQARTAEAQKNHHATGKASTSP
jgi:hypothetical protein